MGETTTILNPAKQQRRAIRKQRCSGIEYAIDPIWPVSVSRYWVGGMAVQESCRQCRMTRSIGDFIRLQEAQSETLAASATRWQPMKVRSESESVLELLISKSAIRNDRVDSAPWFSFARSG